MVIFLKARVCHSTFLVILMGSSVAIVFGSSTDIEIDIIENMFNSFNVELFH